MVPLPPKLKEDGILTQSIGIGDRTCIQSQETIIIMQQHFDGHATFLTWYTWLSKSRLAPLEWTSDGKFSCAA